MPSGRPSRVSVAPMTGEAKEAKEEEEEKLEVQDPKLVIELRKCEEAADSWTAPVRKIALVDM
eukprot:993565-Prorocentrum_minimum.AAC.1